MYKTVFFSKDPFLSWHWIWFLKIICPFFPSTPPNLENMIANPHLGQEFWYKYLPFVYIKTIISKTSFAIMRSLWEPRKYQGIENKTVSILTLVCKFISIIRKKNCLFKNEDSRTQPTFWFAMSCVGSGIWRSCKHQRGSDNQLALWTTARR